MLSNNCLLDSVFYIGHLFYLISQLVQTLKVKKYVTYCNLKSLTNSRSIANKCQPNSISQMLSFTSYVSSTMLHFRVITSVPRQNFRPGYLHYVLDSRQRSRSLTSWQMIQWQIPLSSVQVQISKLFSGPGTSAAPKASCNMSPLGARTHVWVLVLVPVCRTRPSQKHHHGMIG